ncbi:hypothetical protein [Kitasatospora sp. NPDC101183]|uniref:hypothetical protein n=1 Tax=Kitasatospora sp. NPDC101183 TaxID=3364100 RepID=UPI00380B60EB
MSLDSRVLAALGAVVVVGAATVGVSVNAAAGQTANSDHRVTLTVGRSSSVHNPLCFNDGKPLSLEQQRRCTTDAKNALKDGTLPSSDVRLSDRIGIGVTPEVAKTGWASFSNGGAEGAGGQFPISNFAKKVTFSGLLPASSVVNGTGQTLISVYEGEKDGENPTAIWYFVLNTKED